MFGQTFQPHDLIVVGFLVVLEGVLSIDNALVLGLLAKRVPKAMQSRALTYGLVGAFAFRFVAVITATLLLQIRIVQLLGGLYLLYVSLQHFFFPGEEHHDEHAGTPAGARDDAPPAAPEPGGSAVATAPPKSKKKRSPRYAFWSTVLVIELTDIAFAVDSILAAVGLVGERKEKTWVVLTGGLLGVVLMRFAAMLFIRLLERFPRFETAAYLLIIVIGLKLMLDYLLPNSVNFHDRHNPAFWVFWIAMIISFCVGFIPKRHPDPPPAAP